MVFVIPPFSLGLRYDEAYRHFTWEGVRVSGVKILPEPRKQNGPTCIYEAIATWMEVLMRLRGRPCKLSSEDLYIKEKHLQSEETDRTMRCLKVVKNIGICSDEDFKNQKLNPTLYGLQKTKAFCPKKEQHLLAAVEIMKRDPLLIVFHVAPDYPRYIFEFYQRPVLNYKTFEEGRMLGHAACSIAYGTEGIVPFWGYINSHGKIGPTKGLGRVLPQHVYYLIAPEGVWIGAPPYGKTPLVPNMKKRKMLAGDDEFDSDPRPLKKQKQDHPF